jgi:excinuclease ABC subunit C
MKSVLDDIPGVGPRRKEALRKHFGTIKAIKAADIETLAAVVPRGTAEAVWNHFHK